MLEKKQVNSAVDAVLKLLGGQGNVKLVDQPQKIDIQFTLKHIPKIKNKAVHIDLPNSIHFDSREVCLFVKDLDKKSREYEATVQHYEDMMKKGKVKTISKIVPIKALRTDYSLPSSKVSLAKAYDLFLGDAAVMGLLPGILGKIFYAKKKTMPVKVNLNAKPLKKEIDRVVDNTRCVLHGSGSSFLVTVAHDRMKKSEVVANVLAACVQLAEKLPGGQENIRNIYVKGADTTAVPVYLDLESANNVKLPEVKPTPLAACTDDISTVLHGKLMVRADGIVQYIRDPVVKEEKPEASSSNEESDSEESDDEEEDEASEGSASDDEGDATRKFPKENKTSKTKKKQGAKDSDIKVNMDNKNSKQKSKSETTDKKSKKETMSETTSKKRKNKEEVVEQITIVKKLKEDIKTNSAHVEKANRNGKQTHLSGKKQSNQDFRKQNLGHEKKMKKGKALKTA